jgi:hypothetical protein
VDIPVQNFKRLADRRDGQWYIRRYKLSRARSRSVNAMRRAGLTAEPFEEDGILYVRFLDPDDWIKEEELRQKFGERGVCRPGDRVQICDGVFKNLEGDVSFVDGSKASIHIRLHSKSIIMELDVNQLRKCLK